MSFSYLLLPFLCDGHTLLGMFPDPLLYNFFDTLKFKRFSDVVVCSQPHGIFGCRRVAKGRHYYNREIGANGLDLPKDVDPIRL